MNESIQEGVQAFFAEHGDAVISGVTLLLIGFLVGRWIMGDDKEGG